MWFMVDLIVAQRQEVEEEKQVVEEEEYEEEVARKGDVKQRRTLLSRVPVGSLSNVR
jgi:hypothetical protein